VLIVDDNPDDRLDIKAALRNGSPRSFAFVDAGTVQEATTRLKDAQFDCVVLDFNLPDGTAFDLLDGIPHEAAFDGLATQLREPVVVITDGADTRTGRRVLEKGAQEFVPKGGVTGILSFVVARAVDTAVERHALARQIMRQTQELVASEEPRPYPARQSPCLFPFCKLKLRNFTNLHLHYRQKIGKGAIIP